MRYIATIRNKVVHEYDYKLDSRRKFLTVCDECENISLMTLITLAAMLFYYAHWDVLSNHF